MVTQTLNLTEILLTEQEYRDDLHIESKADSVCNFGTGCGTAGKCFAKEHGQPDLCGKKHID